MRDRLRLAAVSEMERRRGEFIGVQLHSKVSIFSHPSGGYGTHMYAIAAVPPLTYLCRRFKEGSRERGGIALLGQTEKPRLPSVHCPSYIAPNKAAVHSLPREYFLPSKRRAGAGGMDTILIERRK